MSAVLNSKTVCARKWHDLVDKFVCGYVDDTGSLNPGYNSHADRVADFVRLGAAVVKRYNEIAMNREESGDVHG